MKILFVHLLNNYTGSPKVLSLLLKKLAADNEMDISLLTSRTDGILNDIHNVKYYDNFYRWHENKIMRALQFAFSQACNFIFTLFADFDILYINTVVPFGAAFAAKMRGKKIIYHVHEMYIHPGFVKRLYFKVMRVCAEKVVCVSNYVRENIDYKNATVVYNPIEFSPVPSDVDGYLKSKFENKMVFMPTSLKEYKGIFQFVELARMNSDFHFILLCSSEIEEMEKFFSGEKLPENLLLNEKRPDLKEFYRKAVITMNLSLYDKFIETFGLTVLESFDAFVPAIAPYYGGPKEIVQSGKNGFLVDSYNLEEISICIRKITKDFETYRNFALCAKERSKDFRKEYFLNGIKGIISSCTEKEKGV